MEGTEKTAADQTIEQSLEAFRRVLSVALAHLEDRREEINDLNVFPVADGDTGDNMALTLRHVLDEIKRLEREAAPDLRRPEIVHAVARAALMGARGNSGVILSQIVRGAAEELATPPGRLIDPILVASALAGASRGAYASVRDPAEGTMLTVVREMATEVVIRLAHWENHLLAADASVFEQIALLADMLNTAVTAAEEAVRHTPEQLDVLAEAGVVDAGALGLAVIMRGIVAGLAGDDAEIPEIPHYAPPRVSDVHHAESRFRYCTNFIVIGEDLDSRAFVADLERIGDSVLVVGDEETLKVHVHTDDPDAAKALFADAGAIEREDIADMRDQIAERDARLQTAGTAVVAVVSGDGIARLYESLGAATVDGGPTLNPSTNELLRAIDATGCDEVVVLPNSPNVHMAATEAARLAGAEVRVVPTVSQQAGLAVVVEHDPEGGAAGNAERLAEALRSVREGGVAPAVKDDVDGRFQAGDCVGFEGDEVIAWGEPANVFRATVERLADGAEVITVIAGEGAPIDPAGLPLDGLGEDIELEHHEGGQPNWYWLIAAQ